MAQTGRPTEEAVYTYLEELSNWGRWGPDDQLGTLNLLGTPERLAALRLVREGRVIGCGRVIGPKSWPGENFPWMHFMTATGEAVPESGKGVAADWFAMPIHGFSFTHIDALTHEFWDGKTYNGHPASDVKAATGATRGGIHLLREGVVGRGVLLDIPRLTNRNHLGLGEGIGPEDLEAAESSQGVRVGSGDVLFVRTGIGHLWNSGGLVMGQPNPGLHAGCLPWLHERGVAVLGSDGTNDVRPSGYSAVDSPIHIVGIVKMGLWLIDNADFEGLAVACAERGRWDFMAMVSPLLLKNTTGSPVNPLAVF